MIHLSFQLANFTCLSDVAIMQKKAEAEHFSVSFVSLKEAQIFDFVSLLGIKVNLIGSVCQLPRVTRENSGDRDFSSVSSTDPLLVSSCRGCIGKSKTSE